MHRAVDGDVVGQQTQTGNLRVEADIHIDAVGARLEQQRVTSRTELVGLLLVEDIVQLALDRRCGHARIEDQHVRTEVRRRL